MLALSQKCNPYTFQENVSQVTYHWFQSSDCCNLDGSLPPHLIRELLNLFLGFPSNRKAHNTFISFLPFHKLWKFSLVFVLSIYEVKNIWYIQAPPTSQWPNALSSVDFCFYFYFFDCCLLQNQTYSWYLKSNSLTEEYHASCSCNPESLSTGTRFKL